MASDIADRKTKRRIWGIDHLNAILIFEYKAPSLGFDSGAPFAIVHSAPLHIGGCACRRDASRRGCVY